jgi:hypothetical protein
MTYLHCIDFSNKLKVLNFTSTGGLYSLLAAQLISGDNRPNPMSIDIEKLYNCTVDEINGMSSPRMLFVFQRTIFKSWKHRKLSEAQEKIVLKGELEIQFEIGRRQFNYGAPSRLSCLYLIENNIDSSFDLNNMFADVFKDPLIVEVQILDKFELMKFDFRWVDEYYKSPSKNYIEHYWNGLSYDEKKPKWEYLLEGSIQMINKEQYELVEEYSKSKYTNEYEAILLTRQQIAEQGL